MADLEHLPLSSLDKLKIETAHDEDLRGRFLADPAGTMAERGIPVPDGVTINATEDQMDSHTIVLPPFVGTDLAKANIAASDSSGTTWCTTCTATTPFCFGSLASLTCA